ncbi:MAG: class I SAM-dependent methyltransferase [Fimbriimonadaceae bacterium]
MSTDRVPEFDAKQIFSDRARDYAKARPGYPAEILAELSRRTGLDSTWQVADLGAGTGLLTRLFVDAGNPVVAVEPNGAMLKVAETRFGDAPNFRAVTAPAEATTLDDRSVDLITAGQAFHWFDRDRAAPEFRRILRPGGWIALIWNDADRVSSPFLQEYLPYLSRLDQPTAPWKSLVNDEILQAFIGPTYQLFEVAHRHRLDFDGLVARLGSASYGLRPGESGFDELSRGMREIFDRHADGGTVDYPYRCRVHLGQWS